MKRVISDLNQMAENGREAVSFFKVDIDKYPEYCENFNIYGIPSVVLFNEGREVNRIMGVVPKRNYDVIYSRFTNRANYSKDLEKDNSLIWLTDRITLD